MCVGADALCSSIKTVYSVDANSCIEQLTAYSQSTATHQMLTYRQVLRENVRVGLHSAVLNLLEKATCLT